MGQNKRGLTTRTTGTIPSDGEISGGGRIGREEAQETKADISRDICKWILEPKFPLSHACTPLQTYLASAPCFEDNLTWSLTIGLSTGSAEK